MIVFLGDNHKKFIRRQSLNSYRIENMLTLHKPKCENNDITTTRTSSDSHIFWKKHFQKNPLYFRKYPDVEADNEIDNSSIGNITTNIYEQNPLLNGYHIKSELKVVLEDGCNESPLGYGKIDWYVNEVIELEKK